MIDPVDESLIPEARIRQARARLEQMGIIDRDGRRVSREVPPDMRPSSVTSVEAGRAPVADRDQARRALAGNSDALPTF